MKTPIKGMKVLIVSDIHFPLSEKEMKDIKKGYSQCWLLGDISSDTLEIITENVKCPIYGVLGNHDTYDTFKKYNIMNINGGAIRKDGYTIAGIEGSSKYKENTPYVMLSQTDSILIASRIPKADILISHDSAFHIHSKAINKEGLQGIEGYIEKYKPALHIYGHHHKFTFYKIENTLCICNYRLGMIDYDGIYRTLTISPH